MSELVSIMTCWLSGEQSLPFGLLVFYLLLINLKKKNTVQNVLMNSLVYSQLPLLATFFFMEQSVHSEARKIKD